MNSVTFETCYPLHRRLKSFRRSRNMSSMLAQVLTERITSGVFETGQKLPSETQLMVEHGVSRNVVREAISQLQTFGLIITRHGIGSFVSYTRDFNLHPGPSTTLDDVLAVIELRISIEVDAAGLAAQRRTQQHLEGMCNALNLLAEPTTPPDVAAEADNAFHRQLSIATDNRYFTDITNYFHIDLISRKRLNIAALDDGDRLEYWRCLHREYLAIYHSIADGDPGAAKAAMHRHLSGIRERIKVSLANR